MAEKKQLEFRAGQATSYDVARKAGVSQSAVSRCFKPRASVALHTRQKIMAAARALGYPPKAIARRIRVLLFSLAAESDIDEVFDHVWSYQVTTVRQPVRRMIEVAVSMLLERIKRPELSPEQRLFAGELLPGASARLG